MKTRRKAAKSDPLEASRKRDAKRLALALRDIGIRKRGNAFDGILLDLTIEGDDLATLAKWIETRRITHECPRCQGAPVIMADGPVAGVEPDSGGNTWIPCPDCQGSGVLAGVK